jgi:hypothetical protein
MWAVELLQTLPGIDVMGAAMPYRGNRDRHVGLREPRPARLVGRPLPRPE